MAGRVLRPERAEELVVGDVAGRRGVERHVEGQDDQGRLEVNPEPLDVRHGPAAKPAGGGGGETGGGGGGETGMTSPKLLPTLTWPEVRMIEPIRSGGTQDAGGGPVDGADGVGPLEEPGRLGLGDRVGARGQGAPAAVVVKE